LERVAYFASYIIKKSITKKPRQDKSQTAKPEFKAAEEAIKPVTKKKAKKEGA
jgi:hypothetical protein